MDAPPTPLRSPDGLWWWDGRSWQPVATLGAPPPPPADVPPAKAEPSGGAWQPPAQTSQPPAGGWQPPSLAEQPPAVIESPPATAAPPTPSPALATEQVRGAIAWPPPGAAPPEPPPTDPRTVAGPATAPAAPPPQLQPETPWQPPPGYAAAPPAPPAVTPAPPASPAQAAAGGSPQPDVPWPGWLPHTERSEAIVQEAPTHARTATAPPLPQAGQAVAPPGPPVDGPPSGWVARLYPARAALTSNRQLVTYGGLGVLGLIALFVLFQVLSQMNLFGAGVGSSPPETGPTGTQFQQADRFITSLNPALDSITFNATQIPTDCGGTHSVSCQSTLENADAAFLKAIAVIDKGPFPSCLGAPIVQTRHDLVNLDQAIKASLIGFKGNDAIVTKGLADFAALAPTLKANRDALRAAEQASCPKAP